MKTCRKQTHATCAAPRRYHVDTGAANEHVPMNDQGFYLPFWQRLLLRSTYVALCTLVAVVMPFFSAVVGLVGAIT